jgi:hypothetical protein
MRRFALQKGPKVHQWGINYRISHPIRYLRGGFRWEWRTFRCLFVLT